MPAIYGLPNSMAFRAMMPGGFGGGGVGAIGEGVTSGVQALLNMLGQNKEIAFQNRELGLRGQQVGIDQQRAQTEQYNAQTQRQNSDTSRSIDESNMIEQGWDPAEAHRRIFGSSIAAAPQQAAGVQPSSLRSMNSGASINSDTSSAMEALQNAAAMPQQGPSDQTQTGRSLGSEQAVPYDPTHSKDYVREKLLVDQQKADLSERSRHDTAEEGLEGERNRQLAAQARATLQATQAYRGDELTNRALSMGENAPAVKNATNVAQATQRMNDAIAQAKAGNPMALEVAFQQLPAGYDQKARITNALLHATGKDPSIPGAISQYFNTVTGHPEKVKQLDMIGTLSHNLYSDASGLANNAVAADSASQPPGMVNAGVWPAIRSQYALPGQSQQSGPSSPQDEQARASRALQAIDPRDPMAAQKRALINSTLQSRLTQFGGQASGQ